MAEVAGIEPTGRGSPVPLVLKTRGATRPRSPPPEGLAPWVVAARRATRCPAVALQSPGTYDGGSSTAERVPMKKFLVLLILVAIGVAVAKKVREA